MIYHGSSMGELKSIKPSVSTHQKSFVYATEDFFLAVLFCQKWNDFIFNVAYGDDGLLEITERYAGALEEIFGGKGGFVYTLPKDSFAPDATRFEGEVVSSKEAEVRGCEKIDDILSKLTAADREGKIRLRRYPDRHPDIPDDDGDLAEEALALDKSDGKIIHYCLKLHPHLAEKLERKL